MPESEANREYFANQQLNSIANGNDAWHTGETTNDRLLKLARSVQHDRTNDNKKLLAITGKRSSRLKYINLSFFFF